MFTALLTLAVAQATPAPATPPAPTPAPSITPPPAFSAAAQAFGECVGKNGATVPATTPTDAGAKAAIAACATEQATMSTQFEAWITDPTFPAAYRDVARAQYQAQMAGLPDQIGRKLAERRAAGSPAPTPSPTPGR